ncbi:MAG: hypothetical protein OEM94_11510, partial [Acidimicrobiia bacterium]|nr:hypothetical protein [Acidimicrobiia bacterium]
MSTGDSGEFTPHPGDPWHPDWKAGQEPTEEQFVPEAETKPPKRRGLLRRRAVEEEADLEDTDVEGTELEEILDDADAELPSSVDAYNALRTMRPGETASPPEVGVAQEESSAVLKELLEATESEPAAELEPLPEPEPELVPEPAVELEPLPELELEPESEPAGELEPL